MKTIEIICHGFVQGVGFRFMTQRLAQQMHVRGTVENLGNGDVRIIAQGDTELLEQFTALVKKSPSPSGRVDQMIVTELPDVEKFKHFTIIG